MNAKALWKLTRPALAPTAAADVLAGAILAGDADPLRLGGAALASVCLYAGGMVQNDLCDRKRDAVLHPGRPLVREPGLVGPAYTLLLALFAAGLLIGWVAGVFWYAVAVLVLASAYNLGAKRKFPADALVLGAARAANLSLGFAIAGASWGDVSITYGMSYLVYIGAVTAASRAEDREPPTRRLMLFLAFLAQLFALGGLASLSFGARTWALALPAGALLSSVVPAIAHGTREAAMRYVLRSLLVIYLLHGAALWAAGHDLVLLIVAGLGLGSMLLLRKG